jgi:protein-S-isoprenylcysteine O-methyltransferase Ste14
VRSGVYGISRNPMYLGHLVFLTGLAAATRSRLAGALLAAHLPWFQARVRRDEEALAQRFGRSYAEYRERVPRWFGPPPPH